MVNILQIATIGLVGKVKSKPHAKENCGNWNLIIVSWTTRIQKSMASNNIHLPTIGKVKDTKSNAFAGGGDVPRPIASEGKLGKINDIATRRREYISNINDMEKEKLRIESKIIDKQITTLDARYMKDLEPLRRNYEELKATMIFLERKRLLMKGETKLHRGIFGSCGEINKYEIRQEVKKILDSSKPSRLRQRKIDRLMEKGKEDGRISNDIDIMRKFNAMMKRPFKTPKRPRPKVMVADKKKRQRSFRLPALAAVIQDDKGYGNFYSSGPIRLVLERS